MSIFIHKILKSDLSYDTGIEISLSGMTNTTSMTISHYADSDKAAMATIPYEIVVVRESVPIIKEVEFGIGIRKTVDLTAVGVNKETITNIGNDTGANSHTNQVPHRPLDLPPNFIELYKG